MTDPTPDETSSLLEVVRSWAREMVSGRLSPIDGARRIVDETASATGGLGSSVAQGELAVFHQLVRDWETDEGGRPECERRILEEVSLILADTA